MDVKQAEIASLGRMKVQYYVRQGSRIRAKIVEIRKLMFNQHALFQFQDPESDQKWIDIFEEDVFDNFEIMAPKRK